MQRIEKFSIQLNAPASKPLTSRRITESEKLAREELACAYRLAFEYGWDELIFNHISYRIDDDGTGVEKFLINPFGLGYDEVTASNLVLVDTEGNVIDPGSGTGSVNKAGFVIHSAIHKARPEIRCVLHSHQDDVTAIASREGGLSFLSQTSALVGPVTYHDYEGIAVDLQERASLARDIGTESRILLLRNHGCLALGSTVGEAFVRHFFLVRACQIQLKATSAGIPLIKPKEDIQKLIFSQLQGNMTGQLEFQYLKRRLEKRIGTDWKN